MDSRSHLGELCVADKLVKIPNNRSVLQFLEAGGRDGFLVGFVVMKRMTTTRSEQHEGLRLSLAKLAHLAPQVSFPIFPWTLPIAILSSIPSHYRNDSLPSLDMRRVSAFCCP